MNELDESERSLTWATNKSIIQEIEDVVKGNEQDETDCCGCGGCHGDF